MPRILDHLMPLPKREQDDLARLLVRTPMSKLIEANTILASRLDFLAAFREMAFDPATSRFVKERKELHKILEKELWVFGDEYTLLASDRSLDEVLDRHIAILRPELSRRRRSSTAVRRADGSRGIVDLMLSQQRRGVDRREHLVVELKRPSVTITQTEVAQLKSYADAVPPTRSSTPSTSTGTSGSSRPTWKALSPETRTNPAARRARSRAGTTSGCGPRPGRSSSTTARPGSGTSKTPSNTTPAKSTPRTTSTAPTTPRTSRHHFERQKT